MISFSVAVVTVSLCFTSVMAPLIAKMDLMKIAAPLLPVLPLLLLLPLPLLLLPLPKTPSSAGMDVSLTASNAVMAEETAVMAQMKLIVLRVIGSI